MADQPKRVLFIYNKLQTGRRYSSHELKDMIAEELDNDVSLRSIQRDLKILYETIPSVTMFDDFGEVVWGIQKEYRNPLSNIRIQPNELLSYYVLKAHLKSFKGTYIEDDIDVLTEKLEDYAPASVITEDALFWDQNIGQYDYTQSAPVIKHIIECIVNKNWVTIEYNTSGLGKINSYNVRIRTFFTYSGMLYVIAYIPHHDTDVALTVQYIESIEDIDDLPIKIPPFDFRDWTKNRFGVFYGKPEKITLLIKPEFVKYFENRIWHQSQKIWKDEKDRVFLEFKAPATIDLVSWILSWNTALEVKAPARLRTMVYQKLAETMNYYKRKNDNLSL